MSLQKKQHIVNKLGRKNITGIYGLSIGKTRSTEINCFDEAVRLMNIDVYTVIKGDFERSYHKLKEDECPLHLMLQILLPPFVEGMADYWGLDGFDISKVSAPCEEVQGYKVLFEYNAAGFKPAVITADGRCYHVKINKGIGGDTPIMWYSDPVKFKTLEHLEDIANGKEITADLLRHTGAEIVSVLLARVQK